MTDTLITNALVRIVAQSAGTTAPIENISPITIIKDATVQSAPPTITANTQLQGTVVAGTPSQELIRIATAQGDVEIKAAIELPANTKVILQFSENSDTRLQVTLSTPRATTSPTTPIEPQQAPVQAEAPPPLTTGSRFQALYLPDTAQTQETQENETAQLAPQLKPQVPTAANAPVQNSNVAPTPNSAGSISTKEVLNSGLNVSPNATLPPAEHDDSSLLDVLKALIIPKLPASAEPSQIPQQMSGQKIPPPLNAGVAFESLEALQSEPASPQQNEALPLKIAQFIENFIQEKKTDIPLTLLKNLFMLNIQKIILPAATQNGPPSGTSTLNSATALAPQPTNANKAMPQQPPILEATVEAFTTAGNPILKTADGSFVLRTPASVPLGTRVIFSATPATPTDIKAAPVSAQKTFSFVPLLSQQWSALEELLTTQESTSAALTEIIKNYIPSVANTDKFAATLHIFLAALKLGALDKWLAPDVLQGLRQAGKKDLLEILEKDFGKIANRSKDISPEGWRGFSVPIMNDEQISQVQIYVRHHYEQQKENTQSNDDKGNGKPSTRFILNLGLSRMGDMQLDGYIHQKKFDMILRSAQPLTPDMRHEIAQRFTAGLEQVRMQGGITFQAQRENWVTVDTATHNGNFA